MTSLDVEPVVQDADMTTAAPTQLPAVPAPPQVEAMSKPKYKSYRKKFRKMHIRFTRAMDEAHTLYLAEDKAAETARRIQEENDKLMELLLEINQSVQVPAKYRFNLDSPTERVASSLPVVSGEDMNLLIAGGKSLESLAKKAVHTEPSLGAVDSWPEELREGVLGNELSGKHAEGGLVLPGFLTTEHEATYLTTVDKSLAGIPHHLIVPAESEVSKATLSTTEGSNSKADIKRANALSLQDFTSQYPNSAHNWLRLHAPSHSHGSTAPKDEDGSQRGKSPPASKRKKAAAGKNSREDKADPVDPLDEELGIEPEAPTKGKRKRLADGEDAYRPKGGSGGKKRKRASDAGEVGPKKKRAGEED